VLLQLQQEKKKRIDSIFSSYWLKCPCRFWKTIRTWQFGVSRFRRKQIRQPHPFIPWWAFLFDNPVSRW
jgi:hypothetical protein